MTTTRQTDDMRAQPTEAFRTLIRTRLTTRTTAGGVVCVLNLRQRQFARLGFDRLTLRHPAAPGWPDQGCTTDSEEEAVVWLDDRYTRWLWNLLDLGRSDPDAATRTVRQAAQAYLNTLTARTTRVDGTTVDAVPPNKRSRVSLIRSHVVPQLGHLLIAALDRETVERTANALTVRKPLPTAPEARAEAARGTKRNFIAALQAIWAANFRYKAAPFAGARIGEPGVVPGLSDEVNGFDEDMPLGDEKTGALDGDQLFRALVAATYYDRKMSNQPNLHGAMIPNTAHAIAMQAGLGTRVSELLNIRHGHIHSRGYAIVHNAKRKQVNVAKRLVPVPVTLEPWIAELRAMEGRALDANAFAIRTDPNGSRHTQGAQTSIARRIATALALAGVKVEGKATHGLRATFASHADASPDVPAKTVQRYLGHHRVYHTSTDQYVRQMQALMRPSHRHIITLPSPDAVRAALETFVPAPLPLWKERRKSQARSTAAQRARRHRPSRGYLGVLLDLPRAHTDAAESR
jgi:integrase